MAFIDYLRERQILFLLAIIIGLAVLDALFGGPNILHFGIEFIGGTQIPITLEHSVTPDQMANLTNILQQRVSTFGLKQVTIEGVGSSEIYVIIPSVSGSEINSTINIIESQGVFQGVVNGKEAINGSAILSGSVAGSQQQGLGGNVTWLVGFFITQNAAQRFAKVAFGQANQPLYLFLDRPSNSILLLNNSLLLSATHSTQIAQGDALAAVSSATILKNATIPVELMSANASNWNVLQGYFASHNAIYRKVLLAQDTPAFVVNSLRGMNYSLVFESTANMTPQFIMISASQTAARVPVIQAWPAIGLLSAPVLSPGVTNGSVSQSYQISGTAPLNLTPNQRLLFAQQQSKSITSILSGGSLPVKVIVGGPTTIPPTLGTRFLFVSFMAALLAVVAVSLVIVTRYKKIFLILPIILTALAELFIIVSIIGLIGTIDLAAVAGMIAVVGTGVDAQIIITDEVLAKASGQALRQGLESAFYIIWADAALIIIAMLPLLFSTSLVSIIGFSESTILGALLGVVITRPAYGAILTRHYSKGQ